MPEELIATLILIVPLEGNQSKRRHSATCLWKPSAVTKSDLHQSHSENQWTGSQTWLPSILGTLCDAVSTAVHSTSWTTVFCVFCKVTLFSAVLLHQIFLEEKMYSLFQDSLFFMPMSGVLLYKSQKFFFMSS